MYPPSGDAAAAYRLRDRKRRVHDATEDVGASGSGDGSTTEPYARYRGVRRPTSKVEIKKFCGELHFYRTVNASREEAAMVFDLAQAYKNPDISVEMLNIRHVMRFLVKEDPALPELQDLLLDFVRKHPLTTPREQWTKDNFAAVQDDIVAKAAEFFREAIAPKCRVGGRRRKDLAGILPSLPEDDPKQCSDLQNENQDLKDENQNLKDKAAEDASTITRLQESLQKALALSQPEVLPQYDHLSPEWWLEYDFGEPAFN